MKSGLPIRFARMGFTTLVMAVATARAQVAQQPLLHAVRPSGCPALSVAVASLVRRGEQPQASDRIFLARYESERWSGDLAAHALGTDDDAGDALWKASEQLPTPARRNLWTWRADLRQAVSFDWASLVAHGLARDLEPAGGASLIDYLRGDRTQETVGWRVRASALGDIVNGVPLRLPDTSDAQYDRLPPGTPGRERYRQALQGWQGQESLLAFAANDGYLHVLRERDGVEVFGFTPEAIRPDLPRLAEPAYRHRFFVDGPLSASAAWWNDAWRPILVGSTGAGRPAVFALDLSRPESLGATSVLWEFNQSHLAGLGHVLAPADVGLSRQGQWIAVLGNGVASADGQARLLVLDLRTGQLVRMLTVDTPSGQANGLGGVRLVRNADQVVVAAYAGDLLGRLWRFDLQAAQPGEWRIGLGGRPLHEARDARGRPRPITAPPDYRAHPSGGQWVLFGTGKLFEASDLDDPQPQAAYGLRDPTPATDDSRAATGVRDTDFARFQLVPALAAASIGGSQVSPLDPATATTAGGAPAWMVDLPPGLRDLQGPRFEAGLVRFSLSEPERRATADPCAFTPARQHELRLEPLTAAMPRGPLRDTNGDGVINASDSRLAGFDSAPGSRGGVLHARDGAARLIDARGGSTPLQFPPVERRRSWRQLLPPGR
jgi:type IV pilus assembly protein PilY1